MVLNQRQSIRVQRDNGLQNDLKKHRKVKIHRKVRD